MSLTVILTGAEATQASADPYNLYKLALTSNTSVEWKRLYETRGHQNELQTYPTTTTVVTDHRDDFASLLIIGQHG